MDIDCDWCICGKKTTNGRLYCSEECKISDCASDSSANSDFSHLSNHSPTNFIPKFYNAPSKKLNKTYVQLLKGNGNNNSKTLGLGYNYNLNACPMTSKGHSSMNHPSPTSQVQIPLSAKYNQANLALTSGGLMTSPIMGINMNTTTATTHVNTSGHIIQASTSAPKITEMDPSMVLSTNPYYNRRYSLPVGHHQQANNNNALNNILINVTIPDEERVPESEQCMEEDGLTPPPPLGLLHTINTNVLLPRPHCHLRRGSNASSGSESPDDDDQTLHSATQSTINDSSLDRLDEASSLRVMPSSSFTKTLKPISEVMVPQSDTTLQNNDISPPVATTTTTTTTTTSTNSPGRDSNNYTLYKTSASTNLCALNQKTNGNGLYKNRSSNLHQVKMMSGGVKQTLGPRHSLKSSSVESAASTNAVTPIYF